MKLRQVHDAHEWDAFVSALPGAQFTQSWAWGEFRKQRGQDIMRLAMGDQAAAFFFRVPSTLVGGYWYAPRGPVGVDTGAVRLFLHTLMREKALPGRTLFWRVEPPTPSFTLPSGFRESHAYMPTTTLRIPLAHSADEMQKVMHEKTRYNIRVAERRGVTVRTASDKDAIDTFIRLTEETAVRDKFRSQPSEYIRATFAALAPQGMARIRLAEKEGTALAASFEVSYGDTVTYLYGASSSAERQAMAPYALHWDAIQAAKEAGYRWYDFHGVNPEDTSAPSFKSSWAGITRFKMGWGGERLTYAGTWELPKMPFLYKLFRLIRPA